MESKFYRMARVGALTFVVLLLLLSAAQRSDAAATSVDQMSDMTLVLPVDSGITTRWVVPPVNLAKPLLKHTLNEIQFSVDAQGTPWTGINGRLLINPVKQIVTSLSEPYQKFLHLDNGALLFSTVRMLGFMGVSAKPEFDKQGYPILPFQPISELPAYYSRIYKGAGNCVYLVAEDAVSQKTALYLLRPEIDRVSGKTELRNYRKIFESREPITAVAGDGDTTFMALGKLVVVLNQTDNKLLPVPVQPDEEVRELAYKQGTGLFYAGASGIGFLGAKRAFRFLETSNARIAVHEQSLYVLFPRTLGVVCFDNINKLWNYDFAVVAGE